jgi:hypothetical protein
MGFGNGERTNFFSIVGGKFVQRVKDGTTGENIRTRVNKNDVLVTEEVHSQFEANLIGIKVEESKNAKIGKQWAFKFQDEKETYTLNLGYSSQLALSILKMLPNVDFTKPLKMSVSLQKGDDGIDRTSIFISQDGKNIPYAHKKEAPNGLPEKKIITVNGEKKSDYTDQIAFLHNIVTTKILPKLGQAQPKVQTQTQPEYIEEDIDTDDIPF